MIVAERKSLDEIKSMVKDFKKVFVVGCGTCVSVCLAGGEKEAGVLCSELELAAKVDGNDTQFSTATIKRQCDREFLAELDEQIGDYDAVISMACGAGIQFMAERFEDKPVVPALNTNFIGVNQDVGSYEEKCRACGNCVLGVTGGVCPVTMCAKGLYNGPCGGTNLGSCELNKDQPCAWHMIYERLSKQNRLDNIINFSPSEGWKNQTPRKTIQPGYEEKYEE